MREDRYTNDPNDAGHYEWLRGEAERYEDDTPISSELEGEILWALKNKGADPVIKGGDTEIPEPRESPEE